MKPGIARDGGNQKERGGSPLGEMDWGGGGRLSWATGHRQHLWCINNKRPDSESGAGGLSRWLLNWWALPVSVKNITGLSTQLGEGEICELIFLDFKVEGISCP